MLDSKKMAEVDQSIAALKEIFIPSLKAYYDECIKVGFSKDQAFQLTLSFQLTVLNK